ncbi:hypothetical protein D6B98_26395 [Bradyrhizobium sp. LVM 105]|nr:hypothetical protein D6B98_26395 [Bradyrhizobium sp. LVM 105]
MSNSYRVARLVLLRSSLLLCGAVGALWASYATRSFWLATPVREVSSRIVANDRFKPGVLTDVLAHLKGIDRPAILQSKFLEAEAIVILRAADETTQWSRPEESDRRMENAEDKIRTALRENPMGSFLWLMLYSVGTARNGLDPKNISYLEQSYATGPNEGWVALRRNRLALAVFPVLSTLVQSEVISEFANTVDSDFIAEAELTLIGVGWTYKERLLSALESVDLASRQALRKRLSNDGIKVSIPGLQADERPW